MWFIYLFIYLAFFLTCVWSHFQSLPYIFGANILPPPYDHEYYGILGNTFHSFLWVFDEKIDAIHVRLLNTKLKPAAS